MGTSRLKGVANNKIKGNCTIQSSIKVRIDGTFILPNLISVTLLHCEGWVARRGEGIQQGPPKSKQI